jgi:CDP-paratose 2-epimerase
MLVITGGCGFIGYNSVEYFSKNNKILVIDSLKGESSKKNLKKIKKNFPNVRIKILDISDYKKISLLIKKIKPKNILALSGQVAVTKSLKDPHYDMKSNFLSIFNLLESIRVHSPNTNLVTLSSNKIYGNIDKIKKIEKKNSYLINRSINEKDDLNFVSPYACSKGASDQYVLDYSRNYNLNCISIRLSCVYGINQHGTEDQGWISWFIKKISSSEKINIFGNGKQVRDILYVKDLNKLFHKCLLNMKKIKGEAFNIGGGKKNSISLIELIKKVEKKLEKKAKIIYKKSRVGDQEIYISDLNKIKKTIKWTPKYNIEKGLDEYINWLKKNNFIKN